MDTVFCLLRAEAEETVDVMDTVLCLRRAEAEVILSIELLNMLCCKHSALAFKRYLLWIVNYMYHMMIECRSVARTRRNIIVCCALWIFYNFLNDTVYCAQLPLCLNGWYGISVHLLDLFEFKDGCWNSTRIIYTTEVCIEICFVRRCFILPSAIDWHKNSTFLSAALPQTVSQSVTLHLLSLQLFVRFLARKLSTWRQLLSPGISSKLYISLLSPLSLVCTWGTQNFLFPF
jgi:hypothetical protein